MQVFKYINDNLYGGIGLTRKEVDILNTKTFQRLRRIKQQGFTNLTFPCAEHTRFTHSLGVLHIMGKMVDSLWENLNSDEKKLLRYAALLHDVGHYPFSHTMEHVYKERVVKNKDLIQSKEAISHKGANLIKTALSLPMAIPGDEAPGDVAHHEQMGAKVVRFRPDISCILESEGIDVEEVGKIITGETNNVVFHQLLHSSVDADRMDYLLRDSAAAGVNYGLIDLDYLIRLLKVGEGKLEYEDGHSITNKFVGVNVKGIHALEHYLMARYFSYAQITYHRTTSAYEWLAEDIIHYLADKDLIVSDYTEIHDKIKNEDEKAFLEFDDSYLWKRIADENNFSGNYEIAIKRETLIERKKVKTLFEEKIFLRDKEGGNERYSQLRKLISDKENIVKWLGDDVNPAFIKVDEKPIKIMDNLSKCTSSDEGDKIVEAPRVINGNEAVLLSERPESAIGQLGYGLKILRVFYIDPDGDDQDKSDKRKFNARARMEKDLG